MAAVVVVVVDAPDVPSSEDDDESAGDSVAAHPARIPSTTNRRATTRNHRTILGPPLPAG